MTKTEALKIARYHLGFYAAIIWQRYEVKGIEKLADQHHEICEAIRMLGEEN